MYIIVLYNKFLNKGKYFFEHLIDKKDIKCYYTDKRIIETENHDIIQLLKAEPCNMRGRQCNLIYVDDSLSIDFIQNEIMGRYEEMRFF
jgi:hypothetical protein